MHCLYHYLASVGLTQACPNYFYAFCDVRDQMTPGSIHVTVIYVQYYPALIVRPVAQENKQSNGHVMLQLQEDTNAKKVLKVCF